MHPEPDQSIHASTDSVLNDGLGAMIAGDCGGFDGLGAAKLLDRGGCNGFHAFKLSDRGSFAEIRTPIRAIGAFLWRT